MRYPIRNYLPPGYSAPSSLLATDQNVAPEAQRRVAADMGDGADRQERQQLRRGPGDTHRRQPPGHRNPLPLTGGKAPPFDQPARLAGDRQCRRLRPEGAEIVLHRLRARTRDLERSGGSALVIEVRHFGPKLRAREGGYQLSNSAVGLCGIRPFSLHVRNPSKMPH